MYKLELFVGPADEPFGYILTINNKVMTNYEQSLCGPVVESTEPDDFIEKALEALCQIRDTHYKPEGKDQNLCWYAETKQVIKNICLSI